MSKIKLVKQKHSWGCGPACLAMVTGRSYDKVIADFSTDFNNDGLTTQQAINYLGDLGYGIIYKEVKYYPRVNFGKEEILKPFADIHLVALKTKFDVEWHFVVMDGDGKFYCPDGLSEEKIKNSYSISESIGIFKR